MSNMQARIADLEKENEHLNRWIKARGDLLLSAEKRIAELEAQGEKREAELIRQVDIVIDLQQYIAEQEKIILAGAQMYNAEREVRGKAEARIAELEAQVKSLQRQREIDSKLIDELRADIEDLTDEDEDTDTP